MRQLNYNTRPNRLLGWAICLVLVLLFASGFSHAQKPTVKIMNAVALKEKLLLKIEILRFKGQNLTLQLRHLKSNQLQKLQIPGTSIVQENDKCIIRMEIAFPAGEIEIVIFDETNLPLCNPRRQNTEENAKYYDPSKGNN